MERTIRQQRLFGPGATLVVALSGGADSSALLDLLSRLAGYHLRLIAAHLNHRLRGAESDTDQEFCALLAARYSIPFETQRIDVAALASAQRLNLEDAGRQARIRFLDASARKHGATAVVLAHHADDQAETVLMRLLRGSGTTGLSGMAYRNERGYVRPLLEITRPEISQYLCERGLEWREDASNSDTAYLRNRIRHELLPLLEEYNPAIRAGLAATAAILGDDEALLTAMTERASAGMFRTGEGSIACSIARLRLHEPALQRRILRHAFRQIAGSLEGVGQRHIHAIITMIAADRPNARLDLPHGITAMREYDRLMLIRTAGTVPDAPFELVIAAPGCFPLGGGTISVAATATAVIPTDAGTALFDLSRTPFPWRVRTFRPGDRMIPLGMSGSKKVKDIFIDRKIPPSERRRIPLLFCGDDLLWIAGVCASEVCRVDAQVAAAVQVTWERNLAPVGVYRNE
jgi:tRNA(Ile)-lysidine synthase